MNNNNNNNNNNNKNNNNNNKNKYLRNFLISLSLILLVSAVIALSLYVINRKPSVTPIKTSTVHSSSPKSVSTSKVPYELGVMIYAIALGFIGLFNMYNSLEIYKKKAEIDKELSSISIRFREISYDIENKSKEIVGNLAKEQIQLRELLVDTSEKANDLKSNLDGEFKKIEDAIKTKQKNIRNYVNNHVNKRKKEMESSYSALKADVDKMYYNSILLNLIPNHLQDEGGKEYIQSAFFWFSQNADVSDLTFLKERLSAIPDEYQELIKLFKGYLDEIKKQID